MWSLQVPQHHHPFTVQPRPAPSSRMCRTSHLWNVSRRLRPPIPVVSIYQASSPAGAISPCAAAAFWWLCPSPSQVRHHCQARPALSLHHPHLPHPPHRQNFKITQTVSDSIHHLLKCLFELSVHQSGILYFPFIILLLMNRCHCVFD